MTKEELFKVYLEDPIIVEKNIISQDKIDKLKFVNKSNSKLLEVIKIAIVGTTDGESENTISRKINKFLNIQ